MSASADIANFQIAPLSWLEGEEGRSFEVSVHLGRGAVSDIYGILKVYLIRYTLR